jgi:hypothetical protein
VYFLRLIGLNIISHFIYVFCFNKVIGFFEELTIDRYLLLNFRFDFQYIYLTQPFITGILISRNIISGRVSSHYGRIDIMDASFPSENIIVWCSELIDSINLSAIN